MNVWQRLQRNQTAFILLVLCCLLGGCSARAGAPKSKVETANAEAASASQQRGAVQDGFPFPQIPAVLTSPEERRSYLLAHYWDEYDFADTVLLHKAEVTEQGLVNYIDLVVSHPDAEEAAGAVDAFCRAVALSDEARKTMPTLRMPSAGPWHCRTRRGRRCRRCWRNISTTPCRPCATICSMCSS